jgi:dihydroneopterin aldolase / 2-amino-4-hydroxy-6-hydroxymethyldihydropteridine diphosphokinase / dihydropteroate synthase
MWKSIRIITNYAYAGNGNDGGGGVFVEGVRVELGAKVEKVIEGLRRWLIIADPGIGYSKHLNGNLEVFREAVQIVEDVQIGDGKVLFNIISFYRFWRYVFCPSPWTEAKDRSWVTAAAVQQNPLIVRVHDVREMMDVIHVTDAIWF